MPGWPQFMLKETEWTVAIGSDPEWQAPDRMLIPT